MTFAPAFQRPFAATFDRRAAGITWLLRDEFTTDLAAGSVNGTAAEPGPGTRTVVDVGNKLWISGGSATIRQNSGWNNEILRYLNVSSTVAGRLLVTRINVEAPYEARLSLGSAGNWSHGFLWPGLRVWSPNTTIGGQPVTGAWQVYALVTRAAGMFVFVKTSGSWRFLWVRTHAAPETQTVDIEATTTNLEVDYVRVPADLWLPTCLVSDGFGSSFGTTDGLGHAEGIAGGIGAGGSGKTWSNAGGTWSVSGAKAKNTPSLGAEVQSDPGLDGAYNSGLHHKFSAQLGISCAENITDMRNGTKCQQLQGNVQNQSIYQESWALPLTNGQWYRIGVWTKRIAGTAGNMNAAMMLAGFIPGQVLSSSLGTIISSATYTEWYRVSRCWNAGSIKLDYILAYTTTTGDTIVVDDVSVKPLALSELVSVVTTSTADVFSGVNISQGNASAAACPSGLLLNCDSAENPQNLVLVYLCREINTANERIYIDKCINGVWSNVGSSFYTYSAGARLVVAKNGTEYRVYYNNAFIVAVTISDAGIVNNTLHGLFSTDASNTLDNLTIYATGTGGEYSYLDQFAT